MNPFVLLAIDAGLESGYAIFSDRGRVAQAAHVRKYEQDKRADACNIAARMATRNGCDLVVARERPNGGWSSSLTGYGAGASWGWWEATIMMVIPRLPRNRVLKFNQSAWAASTCGAGGSSDERKERALIYVANAFPKLEVTSSDVADALCIGKHAIASGEPGRIAKRNPRWHS